MKFKDYSADEWTQKFYADELKEDRKADRPARTSASGNAAAFTSFMKVSGLSPGVHQTLFIFLGMTKGKAPDEEVKFSETEAGRHLPGSSDVADGSFKRRWDRAWKVLENEMRRTGKSLGSREKGSIILGARGTPGKKLSPTYYSEIAQAIVDITREANRMRGLKRDERFRLAAQAVWANLPACALPEEDKPKVKATQESRTTRLAGQNTRRMARFQSAAKEMIEEARRNSPEALEALRSRLHAELETMFADAEDATKSDSTSENEIRDFPQQNDVSQGFTVDRTVHVEGSEGTEAQDFPDYQTWLKNNQERVSLWCSNETETWEMYEAERALEAEGRTVDDVLAEIHEDQKPTAFRMTEKKRKGDVIYAEEFTV